MKTQFIQQFIHRLGHLVLTNRKISQSSLTSYQKRRLYSTNLLTFLLKRFDSRDKKARIADYQVQYCTMSDLENLFIEIFINQNYLFRSRSESPFIIDCGSNIGMSVLYYKMLYPEAKILAFEPDQDSFTCLKNNISRNNLRSVNLYNAALSDSEGQIDFFYDPANPGSLKMSTIEERLPKQKRTVDCTLLSKYINSKVDFLKIDVEGSEGKIIEDLVLTGKISEIDQMVIEYHHHINRDLDEFSNMLKVLEENNFGYQIESSLGRPFRSRRFQDILIYAYQKTDDRK